MTDSGKSWWDFDKILNRLLIVVAVGVAGHAIYMFTTNDFNEIKNMLAFDPFWLMIAYACMWLIWVSHGLEIFTWSKLFQRKLGFHDAFKIAMATDLGVAATPTFIGGGPIKVSMLVKKKFTFDEAATVLAMNPISDVIFHLIFIPLSIIIARKHYDASWLMDYLDRGSILRTGLIIISILVLIIVLRKFYSRKLKQNDVEKPKLTWQERVNVFFRKVGSNFIFIAKKGKGHYVIAFFFNGMKWIMRYLALMAIMMALDINVDYWAIFFFQWIIYISMMFIPTPGAAVGAEASFIFVFKSVIPAGSVINAAMFGWRMLTYYVMLISASVYLIIVRWRTGKII